MKDVKLPVAIGDEVICIKEHPDGHFTLNRIYKINAYQVVGKYAGVRIRDDRRERKDFNFIPTSKNYLWKCFKLVPGEDD